MKRKAFAGALLCLVLALAGCGGGGGGSAPTAGNPPAAAVNTLSAASSTDSTQRSVGMSRQLLTVMGAGEESGVAGRAAGRARAAGRQAAVTFSNEYDADTGCIQNGYINFTSASATVTNISGDVTSTSCTDSFMDGRNQYSGTVTSTSATTDYFDVTTVFTQANTGLVMTLVQKSTYYGDTDTFVSGANGVMTVNGTDPDNFTYDNLVFSQDGSGGFVIEGSVSDGAGFRTTFVQSTVTASGVCNLRFNTSGDLSGVVTLNEDGSGSGTFTQTSTGAYVLRADWTADGAGTLYFGDGSSAAFTDCACACCDAAGCSGDTPYCLSPNSATAACVECTQDSQCSNNGECVDNVCVTDTLAILPFEATDALFDTARSKVYVTDKANKKLYILWMSTGVVATTLTFDFMPERMAMSPDGSKLYVALLTREHSSYWWNDDGHEGYIAEIDLDTETKLREIHINEDPYDLVVTSAGKLVVSGGSGQTTYYRMYDLASGSEVSSVYMQRQAMLIELHPNGQWIYGINTDISPPDIRKYQISEDTLTYLYDSPYHGDYSMWNDLHITPAGGHILAQGGMLFSCTDTQSTDINYVKVMSSAVTNYTNYITDAAFDTAGGYIFTLEGGSYVKSYRLSDFTLLGSEELASEGTFAGVAGDKVYVLRVSDTSTAYDAFDKSAVLQ